MNLLKRVFHWGCLIIGVTLLCFFVLEAILDNKPTSAAAYMGSALSGLMAASGWHNLRKPPE